MYDGSISCTGWELGILAFLGLNLVIFFVAPAPFAIGYICVKRPQVSQTYLLLYMYIHKAVIFLCIATTHSTHVQKFQHYADVLTKDLKTDQRWWGGWDIGRRLPFVFLGYLLVVSSPSIVLVNHM